MSSGQGDARLELNNWNTTRLLFQWAAFHGFPKDYEVVLGNTQDKFLEDRARSSGTPEATLRSRLQDLLKDSRVRLFPPAMVARGHPEYSATLMTALTHAATVDHDGRNRLWVDRVIPFVQDVTSKASEATSKEDIKTWNAVLEQVRRQPSISELVFTDVPMETQPSEVPSTSSTTTLLEIQESLQDMGGIIGETQSGLQGAADLADAQEVADRGFDDIQAAIDEIVGTIREALPR